MAEQPIPTAAEHFEQLLEEVPAGVFGVRSALLALYTVATEDREIVTSQLAETMDLLAQVIKAGEALESRVLSLENRMGVSRLLRSLT